MASRDNQGLQAMLILAVMVIVLLAIMTYFFYRSSDENSKLAAERQAKLTVSEDGLRKATFDLNAMTTMISGDASGLADIPIDGDAAKKAKAEYDKLMTDFGGGLGEPSNRTFSKLLAHLISELQNKNKVGAERTAGENLLMQKNNELKTTTDAEVQKFKEAQLQTAQDLAQRTTEFAQGLQAKDANAEVLQASVAKAQKDADDAKAEAEKSVQDMQKRVAELEALNRKLLAELENSRTNQTVFRNAAAQITWVNQRSGSVWINVGSDDGLQRQTTFSVYDKDVSGIEGNKAKATIEVTKVEPQRAEARITLDYVGAPIVPGDIIYSAAWRPGRKLAFAFAGILDVDGNAKADRGEAEVVRNLVTNNGGEVHAVAADDGTVTGQVRADTRYVVLGLEPSDTAQQAAYRTIREQGKQLGIQEITLDEFLSLTGYQGQVRTIQLGPGSDSEDFKIKTKPPAHPPTFDKDSPPKPLFRPRKPQKATASVKPKQGENGAFGATAQ